MKKLHNAANGENSVATNTVEQRLKNFDFSKIANRYNCN